MNERTSNLAALAGSADLVVAISDFTAAQLLRLVPASRRSRVKVVRCGIDLERFTPRDRPGDQRPADDSSVTKRSLHVVTLGRMAPEKGQWVLIDSVARLVDRGHDVSLRIIGDGDLRADLVRQVDELGLVDRIEFLGLIDPASVRSEIARADLFCLPSFAEGLPVALMEAAAVGTPIVCTSVAGIPELVIDGTTGRCVPAGSSSELVAAIEQFIVDPPSRRAMAEAARARVEARHDRRANTRQLAQLLRDVAVEGRQDAP
jgi:glycosyltransferase involved in cell wall biosynthesis